LNVLRLRQMLLVTVAELFRHQDTAPCFKKNSRTNKVEELWSSEGSASRMARIRRALSIVLEKPLRALWTDGSSCSRMPHEGLHQLALSARHYLQDKLDRSFSLEDLQEALMDVLDNVFSGTIILDEKNDYETESSSIGLSRRSSPRLLLMEHRQDDKDLDFNELDEVVVQDPAAADGISQHASPATLEVLKGRAESLQEQLEATNQELVKLGGRPLTSRSSWTRSLSRVDGIISPLDEVLAMIELNSQIMSPLNRVIGRHCAELRTEPKTSNAASRPADETFDSLPVALSCTTRDAL